MPAPTSTQPRRPTLAFTVDVEDWGQSVFDRSLPIGDHCADNVHRLLDIIATQPNARGTFFILGKFATRHPAVIRRIADLGHEIASHGHDHMEVHRLDPDRFRDDLRRANDVIGGITGTRPVGFRAPVFSITRATIWALDILQREGFAYDSSIYPFGGTRYGIADWPTQPTRICLDNQRSIIEYPLTVVSIAGRRWPMSGGGYARLVPRPLLIKLFRKAARAVEAVPPVFYCHPYEIDPLEWRRPAAQRTWGNRNIPLRLRLHQGIGRRGFAGKLKALLAAFDFHSVRQALDSAPVQASLLTVDVSSRPAKTFGRSTAGISPEIVGGAPVDAASATC